MDRERECFYLLYGVHHSMLTLWVANQCFVRHPGLERSNQALEVALNTVKTILVISLGLPLVFVFGFLKTTPSFHICRVDEL